MSKGKQNFPPHSGGVSARAKWHVKSRRDKREPKDELGDILTQRKQEQKQAERNQQ